MQKLIQTDILSKTTKRDGQMDMVTFSFQSLSMICQISAGQTGRNQTRVSEAKLKRGYPPNRRILQRIISIKEQGENRCQTWSKILLHRSLSEFLHLLPTSRVYAITMSMHIQRLQSYSLHTTKGDVLRQLREFQL